MNQLKDSFALLKCLRANREQTLTLDLLPLLFVTTNILSAEKSHPAEWMALCLENYTEILGEILVLIPALPLPACWEVRESA